MRTNAAGPQKEWWYHRDGCGIWFTLWRDTRTNQEVEQPDRVIMLQSVEVR